MIKLLAIARYPFGFKKFVHRILTAVHGKLTEEDDRRDLVEKGPSKPTQPQSLEQSEKAMSELEAEVSDLQRNRLQNIDDALGTKTHFHETKYYEQRLDSEHIMQIQRIKKKYEREKEKSTGWIQDPQQPQKRLIIRNKKQFIKKMVKLRQYPLHTTANLDYGDNSDPATINFLAKEVLYTSLSMAEIDEAKKTFLDELIQYPDDIIYSERNIYFKRLGEPAFVRASKAAYKKYGSLSKIPVEQTEYVMTVDQVYEALLKLDKDPRVGGYVARIENQELEYLLDRLIWSPTERYVAAVLDIRLKNGSPEYCILVKDVVTDQVLPNVVLDVQSDAVIRGDALIAIQRDSLGLYTEVISMNLRTGATKLLHKEQEQRNLRLKQDPFGKLVFLHCSSIANQFKEDVMVLLGDDEQDSFIHMYLKRQSAAVDCKYKLVYTAKGIVYCEMKDTRKRQDVSQDISMYSEQVFLIPFQEEAQVVTMVEERRLQKRQSIEQLLEEVHEITGSVPIQKKKKLGLSSQRKLIYSCEPGYVIADIVATASHTVLNLQKVWKEAPIGRLEFLPFKQTANETSLQLDSRIRLEKYQDFWSQGVMFNRRDLLENTYRYTVWSQTLEELAPDSLYSEKFTFKAEDDYPIECTMYCDKRFMGQPMMTVLYAPSFGDTIQGEVLRALLKKGVMVVSFGGRGTLAGSRHNFQAGIGRNRLRNTKDLLQVAKHLIAQGVAMDVTAYGKGHIGAFTVLMANILEPELFTASCIFNGHYDSDVPLAAEDYRLLSQIVGEEKKDYKRLNPLTLPFNSKDQKPGQLFISDLSNLIVMTDPKGQTESRKLVGRIRSDRKPYRELYYYEGSEDECDLHAACYLFKHMLFNSTGV